MNSMDDLISRHHVEIKLKELVNEMEEIFSDIREKNVDDSVCGLCEYDCDHGLDGFANECPGFEKDDCFKLKEKYRSEWISTKELPSTQPEIIYCKDCKHYQFSDNRAFGFPVKCCEWLGFEDVDDEDFCSRAERREDGKND